METLLFLAFISWLFWRVLKAGWNKIFSGIPSMKEVHTSLRPENKILMHEDEGDELVTFNIDIQPQYKSDKLEFHDDIGRDKVSAPKAQQKQSIAESNKCWVPKGQAITVAGLTITNGMLYVGNHLDCDNSLINPALKVSKNSSDISADDMYYWPSYANISPKNRRKYLEWLAGGAKEPDIDIGYVFLYFYGLERRLFYDQSTEDVTDIVVEIKRLLSLYGDNYSVSRYLGEALAFSNLVIKTDSVVPSLTVSGGYSWELPLDVRIYIGNKIKSESMINNHDLLLWFLYHPERYLRTPAERLEQEFIALMKLRLDNEYPNGIKLKTPKRKISPEYTASSNTFTVDLSKLIENIPDITGHKAPIIKVQKIAEGVMNDLDKLSRFLGRNPDATGTLKAAALLPPELIPEFGGDAVQSLQIWLLRQYNSLGGVVPFLSLIEKATDYDGTKITKAIHRETHNLLTVLGWNLFPAPNDIFGTAKPDLKILFIPIEKGGLAVEKPSSDFQLALFEIFLGSYIAHADSRVLDVEIDHLSKRVESLNHLSNSERDRLHHYVQWLTIQEVDFSAIKRKLKTLDDDAKEALANIAIAVAAADGQIVPQEVQALEAVYQSMGFDKQKLFSALHSMAGADGKRRNPQNKNSQLSDSIKDKLDKGHIVLDMDRITSTLHDTAKASALLASIFEEDAADLEQDFNANDNPSEDILNLFEGLDSAHAQLLRELLERDIWPRKEYEQLAASLKLMPDGAMETINEWAFETYDDAIIEDDDPLIIYSELLRNGNEE